MEIAGVAAELYGLPLDEFTSTRNQRAKEAKAAGDKELAGTLKDLPKPTLAAWVVNMLARHRAEELGQVLDLGESLRQAQVDLDGAQLRELDRQRRRLTSAVTADARRLAAGLGQKVSEQVAAQVEETLHAAMADPGAAEAVRTGVLVEPLAATGFGGVDLAGVVAVPSLVGRAEAARRSRPKPARAEGDARARDEAAREEAARLEAAREEARAAVAEAEADAAKADKQLQTERAHVERLQARNLQLQAEMDELRRSLAELEHALEGLGDELDDAEARLEWAQERQTKARRAAEEARARAAELGAS